MASTKSILLVDDDESDQLFFTMALRDLSSARLEAVVENGREALERLSAGVLPDVIFTDIQMPVMDGVDLIRAIRSDPSLQAIPIVAMSGHTGRLGLIREAGASAFIRKMADQVLFAEWVQRLAMLDYTDDSNIAAGTFEI